ncbi:MAG: chemotaxis protein CheW [Holosporales bacterium]
MDDLLVEFLSETNESLEQLDLEIVRLEQNPGDAELISSIFRIMHTIKGTCGFLSLPRLESIAHAAEDVMGRIRDGKLAPSKKIISVILESLDQIKFILAVLGETSIEPEGNDNALIACLKAAADGEFQDTAEGENSTTQPSPLPPIEPAEDIESKYSFDSNPEQLPITEKNSTLNFENAIAAIEQKPQPKQHKKERQPKEESKPHDELKDKDTGQAIRVSVSLLENLMNLVSEMVLTRNQLLQIARTQNDTAYKVPLQRLSQVTSELQESVMKTRMQPIGNAWNKLPRIIRDLSVELNKKIELVLVGEDTELDRQILEMIKDPLTHMVRNSADHGIEQPADRLKTGKPEVGTIRLEACQEGGYIIIRISDDGRGLNIKRIREKIIHQGLATEDEVAAMNDETVQHYIFRAGFSTAAQVTAVSGRGVGMDVVRSNIEKIGGTLELWSMEGQGSAFTIKIPLTLAIAAALIVGVGGQRFAIPQLSITELVRVSSNSEHKLEYINGAPVLRLRERLLPLLNLHEILAIPHDIEAKKNKSQFIVVSQVGGQSFGFIVDKVYDTEEIVVKPVAPILRNISVFSGNTILGDGSVIMILDPNGVAARIGNTAKQKPALHSTETKSGENNTDTLSLLVFNVGDNTPRAVPLALIARLEEIALESIEYSNGQAVVQYRNALMPLLSITGENKRYANEGTKPVLVFADNNRAMGIIVDEITDIIDEPIKINIRSDSVGYIGSAIVQGKATDIIDAHYYIQKAFHDWFKAPVNGSNEETSHHGHRILLVDDSAFFRNLLVPVLQASGYQCTAVETARSALELRQSGDMFDLIISDIEMPEMDGLAFATEVSQSGTWASIPMIALSAHTDAESFRRGRQAGFVDYVSKFDRDALIQTIARTLGNSLAIAVA